MRWLGEAARLGCGNVGWLAIGPEFEPLLALPGFDAVGDSPWATRGRRPPTAAGHPVATPGNRAAATALPRRRTA